MTSPHSAVQSLEVLDISYNKLGGPLPEPFAAMGSLRELLLDVNQLSGALPEVKKLDAEGLGSYPSP
jgi:hypothetical protein